MKYNQVYGKYSLGTGGWIEDSLFEKGQKDVYGKSIIDSYIKQVSLDLERIGVKKDLDKISIMDVGTGRQALALYAMGAKKITHYDISYTNVKEFSHYTKLNNIPIDSYHEDICNRNFNNNEKFDFIYLQGIIQHVKDAYMAIENLSKASHLNSKMWFYNYQAGPLNHLYVEVLRKVLPNNINYEDLILKLKKYNLSAKNIDTIVDDLGCTFRNLISNDSYKKALEKFGYVRYYTKDVAEQSKGLDLKLKRTACISAFKKTNNFQESIKVNSTDLTHLDHFDPKNFLPEQRSYVNHANIIFQEIINKNIKVNLPESNFVDVCIPLLKGLALQDINKPFIENQKKLIDNLKATSQRFDNFIAT